jgi:hypothetical protein
MGEGQGAGEESGLIDVLRELRQIFIKSQPIATLVGGVKSQLKISARTTTTSNSATVRMIAFSDSVGGFLVTTNFTIPPKSS